MSVLIDRFDIQKIARLMDAGDYQACLLLVSKMNSRIGDSSAWLLYVKGICEDNTGNAFNGLIAFKSALLIDPYNHSYLTALSTNLEIFNGQLNRAIDDGGIDLSAIQKIHRVLEEAGELTSSAQYLLAKNYLVRKNFHGAGEMISNFLINNPKDGDALMLEAQVHKHSKMIAC